MVDEREFEELTPQLSHTRRAQILPPLQGALQAAEITTKLREAHAMAQFLHESGGFQFKREIASGQAYEGRRDLGNTQPGDGRRYKGRGWIQITGRANYRKYGQILNLPLEQQPELAETDENAARIACAFWTVNNLNKLADQDDILTITRRINGGTHGLTDRRSHLLAAKRILSVSEPIPLDDPEEPFRLLLKDKEISFDAFMDTDNTIWGPLRAMTDALGWTILEIDADDALLARNGEQVRIPTIIRGNRGFGRVRRMAEISNLQIAFDGDKREVRLSS